MVIRHMSRQACAWWSDVGFDNRLESEEHGDTSCCGATDLVTGYLEAEGENCWMNFFGCACDCVSSGIWLIAI